MTLRPLLRERVGPRAWHGTEARGIYVCACRSPSLFDVLQLFVATAQVYHLIINASQPDVFCCGSSKSGAVIVGTGRWSVLTCNTHILIFHGTTLEELDVCAGFPSTWQDRSRHLLPRVGSRWPPEKRIRVQLIKLHRLRRSRTRSCVQLPTLPPVLRNPLASARVLDVRFLRSERQSHSRKPRVF